jgi:hypothetical protein
MYYVRCNTRSSAASSKGTPAQAVEYITDTHDSERDPSYSNAELRYIARLDEGWKQELEGGRLALVGLGALHGCNDQATLAREFEDACQPYHDRRGSTGYLSYTFTIPKEISLVAEGHPRKARESMYAAIQKTLLAAFPGKALKAVTTVHARNEAGEVHYHAHVLVGKFALDLASKRVFSLNSASGGNTGRARVSLLKLEWKQNFDAELATRLGITVTQGAPYAKPALTLADGTYVPALNRESRRLLDKHLCFRLSTETPSGAVTSKNFRWTHFDPTIYELAAANKQGAGWSTDAFIKHFPKLAPRLKTFESRVETLKRIGYLTSDGRVTEPFTLHYCAHRGDHPELQKLRAELYKLAKSSKATGGARGGGAPAPPPLGSPSAIVGQRGGNAPEKDKDDPTVELWLALHRSERLIQRLARLGVSPDQFKAFCEEARRRRPDAETLRRLRAESHDRASHEGVDPELPRTKHIVRAYCTVHKARAVTFFAVTKGLLTLSLGRQIALANKIRARANRDFFWAKERRLAQTGRRLKPLFWLGRLVMPDEVDRLEIAIRRCGQLATRQQSDSLYRTQLRSAYKNSRDALIVQLQHEARAEALAKDPNLRQEDARIRADLAATRTSIRAGADAITVAQLREGLRILAELQPVRHPQLERWAGRETELIAALVNNAKGETNPLSHVEVKVALAAGRAGYLVEKQRQLEQPGATSSLSPLAAQLNRANARLVACGALAPFSVDASARDPKPRLVRALELMRDTGFLDDGPAWTLRASTAMSVAQQVRDALAGGREVER